MAVPEDTIVACDPKIGRMTDISQGGMGVILFWINPLEMPEWQL